MQSNEVVRELIEKEQKRDKSKTKTYWAHEIGGKEKTSSFVTQRLRGDGLTVRILARFCWLLGYRIVLEPVDPDCNERYILDDGLDEFKAEYFTRKAREASEGK